MLHGNNRMSGKIIIAGAYTVRIKISQGDQGLSRHTEHDVCPFR